MARILLADDDKGMLDTVGRALQRDGHVVTTTDDGGEAAAKLGAGAFDLLISDIQMPGVDGIELAQRAVTLQPRPAIVLMSGHTDALDQARKIAGVRVLAKPFQIDALRAIIRAATGT
jgi:two-component system cell cycle response regulator CpdR